MRKRERENKSFNEKYFHETLISFQYRKLILPCILPEHVNTRNLTVRENKKLNYKNRGKIVNVIAKEFL